MSYNYTNTLVSAVMESRHELLKIMAVEVPGCNRTSETSLALSAECYSAYTNSPAISWGRWVGYAPPRSRPLHLLERVTTTCTYILWLITKYSNPRKRMVCLGGRSPFAYTATCLWHRRTQSEPMTSHVCAANVLPQCIYTQPSSSSIDLG